MSGSPARAALVERLLQAAPRDPRIVGLLDYGSGSQGRLDEWSDLDVEVFLRDADFDAFARDWVAWAGQFGRLLLAYRGWVRHPWTVYDAEPVPLRVDFDLHRESEMEKLLTWTVTPVSAEAMVLYDGTGGRLTALVQQLVGRRDRPADTAAAFEQVCGDFWYYVLYVYSKLQRGHGWAAREVFHLEVMKHLLLLLRLEAGGDALDRWRASPAAVDVERTLPPERLARLDTCVPGEGMQALRQALAAAAELGREVCATIAEGHGWAWPEELAARTVELLAAGQTPGD